MAGKRLGRSQGRIPVRLVALFFIGDAGFGVTTPITLSHLARTGELPISPFCFRSLSGPFEQLGYNAFTAPGWALVVVSALDVLAEIWLWQGRRRGARLGLVMTPLVLILGVGFALPALLLLAPIRAGFVLRGLDTHR
ncbi:MAG TPA: hypothetical protein VGC03_03335 [Acidimicrobiia bacterium]|jgi:hypothetical protein